MHAAPAHARVLQRSPSSCGSGMLSWSGSPSAAAASSNVTLCFLRFAAALSGSQTQRICSYRYVVTIEASSRTASHRQELERVLDELLQILHEVGGVPAVDDAVVAGEREVHALADL